MEAITIYFLVNILTIKLIIKDKCSDMLYYQFYLIIDPKAPFRWA